MKTKRKQHLTEFITLAAATVLSIALLILFLKIADSIAEQDKLIAFDNDYLEFVYLHRTRFLTAIMLFATFIGSTYFLVITWVGFCWRLFRKKELRTALFYTLVLLSSVGVNHLLKISYERPRPTSNPLVVEDSFSFPSGHSMVAIVFYSLIAFSVFRYSKGIWTRAAVIALAVVLILSIGFSRVYLGVHYPSDVVAGFIGGLLLLLIAFLLFNAEQGLSKLRKHK